MRYFKATDGVLTIFRASATKNYAFGVFCTDATDPARPYPAPRRGAMPIGFSSVTGPDRHPAVEITAAEYAELQARKVEFVKARGGDPARFTAPYDSWVPNRMLMSRDDRQLAARYAGDTASRDPR